MHNRTYRMLLVFLIGISGLLSAFSAERMVTGERAVNAEDGRTVYAVYGNTTVSDYLPESPAENSSAPVQVRKSRGGHASLIYDVPSAFYFAMVPVFIGLLFLVLYLFVHDIEREDKVILSRDVGSMDP